MKEAPGKASAKRQRGTPEIAENKGCTGRGGRLQGHDPVVQNHEELPENRQLQQNQAGDQLDADARGNQFYRYLSAIFAHQPGQKEKHQQSGRSL
jgi:hypothetical protein